MAAPVLNPIANLLIHPGVLSDTRCAEAMTFVVVQSGVFNGRPWNVGDVVVCQGMATDGEAVVLVARGMGRPRLGTVAGHRFYGDCGEPCSRARWEAAGRIVAVLPAQVELERTGSFTTANGVFAYKLAQRGVDAARGEGSSLRFHRAAFLGRKGGSGSISGRKGASQEQLALFAA